MTKPSFELHIASENSIIIYFGDMQSTAVCEQVAAQIQQVKHLIQQQLTNCLLDIIPSYASLLVVFNPFAIDHYEVRHTLRRILSQEQAGTNTQGKVVTLPVYYGKEVALDLSRIAEHRGLSEEEVIQLHQHTKYRVYTIGFAPGFGYLGEVDERIAMARLSTPRAKVRQGSVAIADRQTAVYPADSPGGWNIIGRCPLLMFDAERDTPMLFDVGDEIKFEQIDKEEFLRLGGQLS